MKRRRRRRILPNGARAIMGSRQEPPDSLDWFPTPPWGTRALMERVLPSLGIDPKSIGSVWEPACGEGHMSKVIEEYCTPVIASDIFDYGVGAAVADFFAHQVECDWIITNPPFLPAEQFALRALEIATRGVALFTRSQWIESVGRYERLFSKHPPTVVAPFVERIPLHKGRWEPAGSTATAYCWVVWVKGETRPTRLAWIAPGCRRSLTRAGDVARFAPHSIGAMPIFSSPT